MLVHAWVVSRPIELGTQIIILSRLTRDMYIYTWHAPIYFALCLGSHVFSDYLLLYCFSSFSSTSCNVYNMVEALTKTLTMSKVCCQRFARPLRENLIS